jgi:hypothetical protein
MHKPILMTSTAIWQVTEPDIKDSVCHLASFISLVLYLWTRPEPTTMTYFMVSHYIGRLLVLLINIRLAWKKLSKIKHSSLIGHSISDEEKNFITFSLGVNDIKNWRWCKISNNGMLLVPSLIFWLSPEPTQVEHIKVAHLKGRFLSLQASQLEKASVSY